MFPTSLPGVNVSLPYTSHILGLGPTSEERAQGGRWKDPDTLELPTPQVLDFLQDPTGATVPSITSVIKHNGRLYMGSVTSGHVSVLDIADPDTEGEATG